MFLLYKMVRGQGGRKCLFWSRNVSEKKVKGERRNGHQKSKTLTAAAAILEETRRTSFVFDAFLSLKSELLKVTDWRLAGFLLLSSLLNLFESGIRTTLIFSQC